MSEIKKIGMYSTDEILKHLTEGEGKGFLGRSMYDAIYFKIEELENINEKLSLALNSAESTLQQKENIIKEVREYIESYGITKEQLKKMSFGSASPISIGEMLNILEILDKANDREEK